MLAQLVVDLACDADALAFLIAARLRQQLVQLLLGGAQGRLGAFRWLMSLKNTAMPSSDGWMRVSYQRWFTLS